MNSSKKSFLTIKELDLTDRPREKLLNLGVPSLSNAELLAIIIGSGLPEMSAVAIMKKLLSDSDNQLPKLAQKVFLNCLELMELGLQKQLK